MDDTVLHTRSTQQRHTNMSHSAAEFDLAMTWRSGASVARARSSCNAAEIERGPRIEGCCDYCNGNKGFDRLCIYIYYYYCYYYYIYYYHLLFIIIYYYCYCYYYTLFGPFILHLDSFGRIVSSNQGSHWGGKPNSIIYWFLQCGYGEHIVYEIDISYTTCTSQTETCTSHLHVNIIHNACLYRSHIHISSSSLCARKIKQSCWVTCGFTTATIPDAEFQMQISLEFTWAIFKTPEVDYCGLKRILPNFSFIIHYGNPWLSDAIEWNDAMRTMRVLRPGERMTTRAQRLRCCIYMQLGTMHGKLHKCWMMLIFFANLNVVTFASVMW